MSETIDSIKQIIIEVENLKEAEKYNEAISLIEKSIISYSDDYRLFEELADIYISQQEIEKSLNAVNFALELNEESATGNYLKGFIMLTQENIEEAITYLERSNTLFGNNPEVLRNLWFAYSIVWNFTKGISILKRALHLSPEDRLITEDLAMALIWSWEVLEWNVLLRQIEKANWQ